jgi:hypothetical protein
MTSQISYTNDLTDPAMSRACGVRIILGLLGVLLQHFGAVVHRGV